MARMAEDLCKSGQFFGHKLSLLLLSNHNFKAVKVRQAGATLLGRESLGPAGGLPGLSDLIGLPGINNSLLLGASGDLDLDVGKGKSLAGDDLSVDTSLIEGTVNQHLNNSDSKEMSKPVPHHTG